MHISEIILIGQLIIDLEFLAIPIVMAAWKWGGGDNKCLEVGVLGLRLKSVESEMNSNIKNLV